MKQVFSGTCDWCKNEADDLMDHKDFEEGFSGQEYAVCKKCRDVERKALEKELKDFDCDWYDYYR